ncbi:MAG TPA: MFS transporter [Acidobacteriaceae bacterium]|jgi:MFS family permease
MPHDEHPRYSHAAWALGLLTALNLFNFIDRYVLPGVQPLVQHEFHATYERMGALTSAFFLTYMLAAPLTGWLGDRVPRKPLVLAGAVLWSVATLLTATVHTYGQLYFRHAVVGIGEATFSVFAPAMIADMYPERIRNKVLSVFYLSIPVGAALGYLIAGQLGSTYGWRMPFLVSAGPGVLIAILIFFFVREPERGSADRLKATPTRATIAGMLTNPGYWTATLGMAMMVFTMGGISVWLPTFLWHIEGYSLAGANQLAGAVTVVDGILGTAAGGWIAQRWLRTNHRALYLVSAWSALLTLPAAGMVFFGPRSLLVPSILLAEFFLFLNTGPLNAAIVNSVSAAVRSTAIAFNLFLIHLLGDWHSPQFIGAVSDRHGLRLGLGLTLITLLLSAGILFFGARFAPPLPADDGAEA